MNMNRYMLRLLPDGDIDIIKECDGLGYYETVYHKTFNPSETIKENLDNAYKEWERLTYENYKKEFEKLKKQSRGACIKEIIIDEAIENNE